MLRYLCVLVAVSVFACDSPTRPPAVRFDFEQRLTEDVYDSGGNIKVYHSRIKPTYHYVIELGLVRRGEGPLQRVQYIIAASDDPDILRFSSGHTIDIAITVSEGFIRLADPGRTLLGEAKRMEAFLNPPLSDDNPVVPVIFFHLGNWTVQ